MAAELARTALSTAAAGMELHRTETSRAQLAIQRARGGFAFQAWGQGEMESVPPAAPASTAGCRSASAAGA